MIHDDLKALDNCLKLDELERLLKEFNIFRVLRFEHGEIRHSNMLAWLLQPEESHGLDDLFLREWLFQIVERSSTQNKGGLSSSEIAACTIQQVEVNREWNYLDIFVKVTTKEHGTWIIAIENKLRARQGENQLSDYRTIVQSAFPSARQTFIFLTETNESPNDKEYYIPAKHAQIHEALSACLKKKRIDNGPLVIIQNYLTILKERCMENSEIQQLAKSIYERHRRALDIIIENRTNPLARLTDAVEEAVKTSSEGSDVVPMLTTEGIVRFLPKLWDTAVNRAGVEFGPIGSAYIIVELGLRWGPRPWLEVVVTKAPSKWREELYQISQDKQFTIKRWNKGTKDEWMRIFAIQCPIVVNYDELRDFQGKATEIWSWCRNEMVREEFGDVVQIVAKHLEQLPNSKAGNQA